VSANSGFRIQQPLKMATNGLDAEKQRDFGREEVILPLWEIKE
jgi:hypothetical protein